MQTPQLPQRESQELPQKWEQLETLAPWRFKLLTSDLVEHKLTTLQDIYRAELLPEYKIYLMLEALRDERAAVREAVFAGLECLGLNNRLLMPLRQLAEGNRQGLVTLCEIMAALNDFDAVAVLMLLLQLLENGKLTCDHSLLLFLRDVSGRYPLPPALAVRFLRLLLDAPWPQQSETARLLWQVFVTLGRGCSDVAYQFLWQELRLRQADDKRTFLLHVLRELGIRPADEEEFFCHISGPELDKYLERAQTLYVFERDLATRSERAVPMLCELVKKQSAHAVVLLEMLERILCQANHDESLMRQCCQTILAVAQKTGVPALECIVWGTLFHNEKLPSVWRKAFAREIVLTILNHKSVPEFYEEMTTALSRLGTPAVEAIVAVLFGTQYRTQVRKAGAQLMRCLHDLTRNMSGNMVGEVLQEFVPRSMEQLAEIASQPKVPITEQQLVGEWVVFLYRLVSMPLFQNKSMEKKLLQFALESLWQFPATGSLINVLAEMFPLLLPASRKQVAQLFHGLLQRNWDVAGYDFDKIEEATDVQIHLYWLPVILQGTARIYLSLPRRNPVRTALHQAILQKWQAVLTWKEVWSPGNITLFLKTMGQLLAASHSPKEQESLAAAILSRREQFAPAAILSTLMPLWTSDIAGVRDACLALLQNLLDSLAEDEVAGGSYEALGQILLNYTTLTPEPLSAVLHALVTGYHRHHEKAVGTISFLLKQNELPPSHRQFLQDKTGF
jgi:hypothetical protein